MNLCGISFLFTIMCSLTIHVPASPVDFKCSEGQRIELGKLKCITCPEMTYQSKPNYSNDCQPCTKCKSKFWSMKVKECSRTHDTICKCTKGFVSMDEKYSACKCNTGSGLNHIPEMTCQKCEDGFFTSEKNKACVKWKECKKSGIKVNGTTTSDVVCNDESESKTLPILSPTPPLATETMPPITQTQRETLPLGVTSPAFTPTITPDTDHRFGILALISTSCFGLALLPLACLIYKCTVCLCVQNYKRPLIKATQDSWRRPVEESGDSNLSSLVKSSTGDP